MNKFLLKTELALADCKEHLESSDNPEIIANYLTQYLSIIFHAEMEQAIKSIFDESVEKRIANLSDNELKEFINGRLKNLKSNSLDKADIAKHIGNFSKLAKERFNELLKDKDRKITIYSNVIGVRHLIAHTFSPKQVTFLELEKAVDAAREILNAAEYALRPENKLSESKVE